jgi:hypothetical protein
MAADIVGTIDNVPPIANAGPPTRNGECGVALTLDGRGHRIRTLETESRTISGSAGDRDWGTRRRSR